MNVIRNWYIKSLGKRLRQYGMYLKKKINQMSFKVRVLEGKRSFPNAKHIFGSRDRRPAIAKKKTQKKISRKHIINTHTISQV